MPPSTDLVRFCDVSFGRHVVVGIDLKEEQNPIFPLQVCGGFARIIYRHSCRSRMVVNDLFSPAGSFLNGRWNEILVLTATYLIWDIPYRFAVDDVCLLSLPS